MALGVKFNYPEEFKNRVRQAFPHNDELHKMLDNGDGMAVGFRIANNQKLYYEWLALMKQTADGNRRPGSC